MDSEEKLDFTEDEFSAALAGEGSEKYHPLDFADPVELLFWLDEGFTTGAKSLHTWQTEGLEFISQKNFWSKDNPLYLSLVACNGSGKDAYLIAPFVEWLLLSTIRHRAVITTSSYTQMKNQTQNYIRSLSSSANQKLASLGIAERANLIKRDHIVNTLTGSEIIMFVTDDPGRAEGYHPFPDHPASEVTLIMNEAKSIHDDIFSALLKCTYTRWIEVSSAGEAKGHFYNTLARSVDYKKHGYVPGKRARWTITWRDCPHISPARIAEEQEEMSPANFGATRESKFFFPEEATIVNKEILDRNLAKPPEENKSLQIKKAGLDFSGGNDEQVACILEGNKIILKTWNIRNTEILADEMYEYLTAMGVTDAVGDDGGIGQAIIDKLQARGLSITRVLNQSIPRNTIKYGNRGAELWFTFSPMVPYLIFPAGDHKLYNQLISRRFKQTDRGRLILESKKDVRGRGEDSPDRADALILATCGLHVSDFRDEVKTKEPTGDRHAVMLYSAEGLRPHMVTRKVGDFYFNRPVNRELIAPQRQGDKFAEEMLNPRKVKRYSLAQLYKQLTYAKRRP